MTQAGTIDLYPQQYEKDGVHVFEYRNPILADAQWYAVAIPYYSTKPAQAEIPLEVVPWLDTEPGGLPCATNPLP